MCSVSLLKGQTSAIKSPDEFLNYKLGSRFTPHHLLVDYFQYIADGNTKVKLIQYGQTYELRPLIAAIISSPQNIARLEEIRQNNLRRTGFLEGTVRNDDIAIVYLSYSVHGNEAAGSEASMAVIYALASGGTEIDKWLSNTIVIIDPSLNPDGYSRYSDWSNRVSNTPFDPNPETREHNEPWPGGRVNHYYFDLNRDWAWQTQKESRDRVDFYQQWMPHVHVDFHEMGSESPYFFAPAAKPFSQDVTGWQESFQTIVGKNNAKYFDKEGWRYYTKEEFDLFYPSYGDTYPTFSGAVGMTFEEGGGGFSDRAVLLQNGDTLTLTDRIAHHRVTSLSTIEASSNHASELTREFELYFEKSIKNPPGTYKSYVIKNTNPGRIKDLITLLGRNNIKYGQAKDAGKNIKGFNYSGGENTAYALQKGDIIIPAGQPRAVLLKALFDPEPTLSDSLTYDISAWSVPMAYGLEAYAIEDKLDYSPFTTVLQNVIPADAEPYAYALQWGSVPAAQLLASLLSAGIVARYAKYNFEVNNMEYPAGTILLMRADNRKLPSFNEIVRAKVASGVIQVSAVNTGFVQSGKDLGSDDYPLVRIPQVVSIAGDGVSPQSIGQVWHFFEEVIHYPVHLVTPGDINDINLDRYNVLILPEGFYSLDNDFTVRMKTWVASGGRIITLGSGLKQLVGKDGFSIKQKKIEPDTTKATHHRDTFPDTYASTERKSISEDIAGAVFLTSVDKTNPLSFGLGQYYMTLKTNPTSYAWLPKEGNAIYINENQKHYGFAGSRALKTIDHSLVAGFESIGGGQVVYLVDNSLFRSFWNAGKVLFSNALFF
ncbi:MAG: M14 family metallopeptidase [Saprospiraceae bacterium]